MPSPDRPLWKDPPALEHRLRAVQPAARLMSERRIAQVLQKVIAAGDRRPPNPRLPVWVEAERLQEWDIIDSGAPAGGEPRLVLLSPPDDRLLSGVPDAVVLEAYTRLLFRAAVEDDLGRRRRSGALSDADLARRFDALSDAVRREIRFVLSSEHLLPDDVTGGDVYLAFVPTYLDLLAFEPAAVPDFFPLLAAADPDPAALLPDLDWRRLRDAVRLGPAPAPEVAPAAEEPPAVEPEDVSRSAAAGNHVRAAILLTRKALRTGGRERDRHTRAAQAELRDGLVRGLARILGWARGEADEWAAALAPLLPTAAAGAWPRARRALYELQKIVTELGRPLYAVAAVEWVRSLGRRPLRRPLDRARDVILLRHLARAESHLIRARLPEADRGPALRLLRHEMHEAERRIRAALGPAVEGVLTRVGLVPANLPERVARDKVVAELLDGVCGRGFLRISDLRDALARNQLKLSDLAGPGELVRGDPLLRADALLTEELYGVYHRGEVYLRLIQRFSAVAFGTPAGRWLTRYVALPFGGAFLTLEFLQHVAHGVEGVVRAVRGGEGGAGHAVHVVSPAAVAGLGAFLLGQLCVPRFRRAVWQTLLAVWRAVRLVAVEAPRAFWDSPPVRLLRGSRFAAFVRGHLLGPAVVTAVGVLAMILYGADPTTVPTAGAALFALLVVVLSTPAGRRFQEETAEAWADAWRAVRGSILPGLYSAVVWLFRALAEWVERGLYAVDEWFRFREGQSKESLALKAVLALVWFPIAYVVRFAFYLLLEPQVNPIKHFPVVTVSHKLMLPLIPAVRDALRVTNETAAGLVFCVPGIFGFLVWELKENWRLYAASRPPTLRPAVLGHHGETMRGLLRPGFHSGTVPKAFRKLRAAHGRPPGARAAALGRGHHDLDHAREAVARLVERDLIPLWQAVPGLAGRAVAVEAVTLGCQRVEVRLTGGGGNPAVLSFENRCGEVVGEVDDPGWLKAVGADAGRAVATGLAGLFALGAAGGDVRWADWVAFWQAAAKSEPSPPARPR